VLSRLAGLSISAPPTKVSPKKSADHVAAPYMKPP
jgi:hypothetical protein